MKMLLLLIILISTTACIDMPAASTDQVQAKQTEKMVSEANRRIGQPGITNFTEKRFVKMLYELRDKEVKTFSYYLDMHGKMHFLCNSIGFGIPASVQFVNPERIADSAHSYGFAILPQPEPNGLFMPDSLSATYVMCIDPKGKIHPVYFEPKLIVSPFKLR